MSIVDRSGEYVDIELPETLANMITAPLTLPCHFMYGGGMYRIDGPGNVAILEGGSEEDLEEFRNRLQIETGCQKPWSDD